MGASPAALARAHARGVIAMVPGSYAAARCCCCWLTPTGFCCYEGAKIQNASANFHAFRTLCKRRIGVVTFGGYFNRKRQRRKKYQLSKFRKILPPLEKILIYTIYVFWGAFFRLLAFSVVTFDDSLSVSFSFFFFFSICNYNKIHINYGINSKMERDLGIHRESLQEWRFLLL